MIARSLALACVLIALAAAPRAEAAGAWTTYVRAVSYTDILAEGDTLWAASLEGGLLRYSFSTGRFEYTVREPGSIASNRVTSLVRDRSGRLFVGTLGRGLNIISSDRRSIRLLNTFDGMPSDTVRALEADGDTVWIGTPRGLALWNGREIAGRLPDGTAASPFASNDIRGFARFDGDLWVATGNGVYRSSLASGLATWRSEPAGLPPPDALRPFNAVDALATDGTTLMALDSLRTFRWEPATTTWVKQEFVLDGTRAGEVTGLWDREGVITGASNVGVLRWNGTRWVNVNNRINSFGSRAQTRFFVVPVALPGGGMVAATGSGFCLETAGNWTCLLPPGPPGNNVHDLILDGPNFYVTCDEDGIGRFDGTSWRYWFPQSPLNNSDTTFRSAAYARGLLVDKQGRKFVGCWNSGFERWTDEDLPDGPAHVVHLWSPTTPACIETVAAHTAATSAALDSSGGHWVTLDQACDAIGARGLDYYDANGNYLTNYLGALQNSRLRAVAVSGSGRVWIGYRSNGLAWFDPPAVPGGPITVNPVTGTSNYAIAGIAARGDDVWVLDASNLRRYRQNGSQNGIYTIRGNPSGGGGWGAGHPVDVGPDGSVWFGTTRGLRRYLLDGSRQDYDVANSPLVDNDVRTVRVDPVTGVVWAATATGISRFDPNYVAPEPERPPRLEVSVYPNPIRLTGLGIRLKLAGDASDYRGRVIDLNGRRVRDFRARTNGTIIWDGRDDEGTLVRPGVYFVRVEAQGRIGIARVAVVR